MIDEQNSSRESVSPKHASDNVQDRVDPVQGGDTETPESADDHESDEARTARVSKLPIRPSQSEVSSHMTTHLPYRSWCPHCVRGKSKGKPHHKTTQEGKSVPIVAMDYMFMHESQSENEEKGMPILVARDLLDSERGTGMIFARVVPQKGVHAYAVKNLAADIALLGHSELVLKSDG